MNVKKNGFVFVESIVAVVILTSSLLLLYSTFSNILQSEKVRIYYDDVNYIYRTSYLKERLNDVNFEYIKDNMLREGNYFKIIGLDTPNLFDNSETEKNIIASMFEDYEVRELVLIKENKLDDLKKCTIECSFDTSCKDHENCNNIFLNLSEEMLNYLKTIYVDITSEFILVGEYETCNQDKMHCQTFFSWVSV